MSRFLATLAVAGLAAGAIAQNLPNLGKLECLDDKAGIEVKIAQAKQAFIQKGEIARPVYKEVRDGGATNMEFAWAKMGTGTQMDPMSPYARGGAGAYLYNYGHVGAKAGYARTYDENGTTIGKDQSFRWTFTPANPATGTVKIVFSGDIIGLDKKLASIQAVVNTKPYAPAKDGRFFITDEIKITTAVPSIVVDFAMDADITLAGTEPAKAMYNGHLSFVFVPTVVQPTFSWVQGQGKSCGKGDIAGPATITAGVPFDIELKGADFGTVAKPAALLLMGDSDLKWWFFTLPFDLSGVGAPGCNLYIALQGQRVVALDPTGYAKVSFAIPGHMAAWFRQPVYFQYAYTTDAYTANTLGLAFTNYGWVKKQ